jgi:hypothetical protein
MAAPLDSLGILARQRRTTRAVAAWIGGGQDRPGEQAEQPAGDGALEFPESSSGGEALFGAVLGRVVGGVVVPAGPHDPEPGAGEDADGVGVVLAAAAGVGIELGGPG